MIQQATRFWRVVSLMILATAAGFVLPVVGGRASRSAAALAATPTCPCVHLVGRGRAVRFALVPAGFDDRDPDQVADFQRLARTVADGFASTEPFASNLDRFSISRVDDYRGRTMDPWTCGPLWYNTSLIEAAGACDYTQIIVIPRRSGCVGGNPSGNFSMAGPGHCPTGGCSPDQIIYTALHEVGHTLAGLRHICSPGTAWMPGGPAEIVTGPPVFLPVAYRVEFARGPAWRRSVLDGPAAAGMPAGRSEAPPGRQPSDRLAVPGQSPLPNCGEGFAGQPTIACSEWQVPEVLRWVLPRDPTHGCYRGCDGERDWYRPWPHDEPAVMCRDDAMKNGFTPVERRIVHDILNRPAPPARATRSCAVVCPRTISDVDDWRRVVVECDGRLWQPEIVPGEPCSDFEVVFTAPAGGDFIFNGVSTDLWIDDDADGIPDRLVIARSTGGVVRIVAGGEYTARGYQPAPGFDLVPVGSVAGGRSGIGEPW